MMGDNRDNSQDSRYWGFLPAEYVKGRALVIYWSYDGSRDSPHANPLARLASVVTNFFTGTRWERLGNRIR
jgi:signal peptidase I